MHYIYKRKDKVLRIKDLRKFKQIKEISVVVPTYNEEECISRIINALRHVLKGKNYEIIIVDDNSGDKTPDIIDSYSADDVAALHRYGKKGIFSAIQDGVKVARSNIIIVMDADFSHSPKTILDLLEYIPHYDIVSCSRFAKGGGIEAPFIKKFSTIILNFMLRLFLYDLKVTDFTGGFHAIKRDKFLDLNFKYPSRWGEFDMELFYRAKNKGYKIKEIPFVYKYREEGKSKSENYLKYAYFYWKMVFQLRFFR